MKNNSIHIIGGGIVGLCSAWYLQKEGFEVCIIDRYNLSNGTSHGNAGMIVPSHFIPMASPGIIAQGLKWLLSNKSPFFIKPRLNLDLMQWLWRFYRAANHQHVETCMPVLYHLNEWSKQLYKEISLNPDFDFGFEERGLLMLYKTEKQAREEEELAEKAHQLGVNAAIMDLPRLKTLEPEMDLDVLGGIYFPGDAHLYPNRFIRQMIAALKQRGVQFLVNTEIVDFNVSGRQITSLTSRSGQEIKVQNVLLTTGAWTGHLLKKLGIKIHLIAGKGYSITIKKPGLRPCIPTLLSEAKVALTPMGDDLRIGGTLELSGVSDHINQRRLSGIMESIPAYYRNLEVPFSPSTKIWQGYRPCTPDGMPYIGKSSQLSNMILGTGHGTMGMSLGPATSKLISQIMTEQDTEIDLHAFRLNRFK